MDFEPEPITITSLLYIRISSSIDLLLISSVLYFILINKALFLTITNYIYVKFLGITSKHHRLRTCNRCLVNKFSDIMYGIVTKCLKAGIEESFPRQWTGAFPL
jgi:hypothetical protein